MNKQTSQFLLYQTENGQTNIDVLVEGDTVWLSQGQMCDLFQRDKSVISRHINNVFREGELEQNSVVAYFATTASDGKSYNVNHYNLDVIMEKLYNTNFKLVEFDQFMNESSIK